MNSGMIAENIFNAIDVIVDKKLHEAQYDSTIVAKVLKAKNVSAGEYEVQYQDIVFIATAIGSVQYQENDHVYILIPINDLSRKKYILGLSEGSRDIVAIDNQALLERITALESQKGLVEIPPASATDLGGIKISYDNGILTIST